MADGQGGGDFFERGVRLFLDVGGKFLRIQLAPFSPARLGGQLPGFGGGQVAIDRAPSQVETSCRLNLGTAGLKKFHDPFPQIQRIGFHAHSLSPHVPMSRVNAIGADGDGDSWRTGSLTRLNPPVLPALACAKWDSAASSASSKARSPIAINIDIGT